LLGATALSGPIIRIIYGEQYLPAIPVLAVATMFAVAKCASQPPASLLQVYERQNFLIWWTIVAGVTNIIFDVSLIPFFGASGAAAANGIAQATAVAGSVFYARRVFSLQADWAGIAKTIVSAAVMALIVRLVTSPLPPLAAVFVGVPCGAVVFFPLVRLTRALRPEDGTRALHLERTLPAWARPLYRGFVRWITPAERTDPVIAPEQA
jgi:O-antigen/teichoic acid export membrane protein